jgi:hypothetical protein
VVEMAAAPIARAIEARVRVFMWCLQGAVDADTVTTRTPIGTDRIARASYRENGCGTNECRGIAQIHGARQERHLLRKDASSGARVEAGPRVADASSGAIWVDHAVGGRRAKWRKRDTAPLPPSPRERGCAKWRNRRVGLVPPWGTGGVRLRLLIPAHPSGPAGVGIGGRTLPAAGRRTHRQVAVKRGRGGTAIPSQGTHDTCVKGHPTGKNHSAETCLSW